MRGDYIPLNHPLVATSDVPGFAAVGRSHRRDALEPADDDGFVILILSPGSQVWGAAIEVEIERLEIARKLIPDSSLKRSEI